MKRGFTLIELIVVVVIILILAAIFMPIITPHRGRESARRSSCQSNLKQIGLGILQYVQDFDERFPPARVTATVGWKDAVMPYIKSEQIFVCPSGTGTTAPLTNFFYNRRMARVELTKVLVPTYTLLSGDGADSQPAWNSITSLPSTWQVDENAPSRRHLDGANYLFADGHVKTYKPVSITLDAPKRTSKPTFMVR